MKRAAPKTRGLWLNSLSKRKKKKEPKSKQKQWKANVFCLAKTRLRLDTFFSPFFLYSLTVFLSFSFLSWGLACLPFFYVYNIYSRPHVHCIRLTDFVFLTENLFNHRATIFFKSLVSYRRMSFFENTIFPCLLRLHNQIQGPSSIIKEKKNRGRDRHPCVCIYCYFFYSVGLFFITGALIEKGPTDPYCVHDIENLFLSFERIQV